MKRRTMVTTAAAMAFVGRLARAAEKPLRTGVLNDMSGVFADYQGPGSVLATQLAVADAGGTVGGRAIEIVSGDHQNKPDVVMNVPNSAIALAVSQFVSERNEVFIGLGAGTADLTGARCTANTLHWDYDTWQTSQALDRAITERGGKTWFTLATGGPPSPRQLTSPV